MTRYVIDGLFLTQRITGIQRFAYEITHELDKITEPDRIEILVPQTAEVASDYTNIRMVHYGRHKGILWEQLDYARYARRNSAECICLTNILPLSYPKGFITIHDISYKVNPGFFTSPRDRISALWHRLNYHRAAKSEMTVITVSEFSKSELMKYYKIPEERIKVIYNAWQHMERVKASEDTFERYPELERGKYYFSMATLAPNKNFSWLLHAAANNPDKQFAVAGGGRLKLTAEEEGFTDLTNIHFLGYVSDGDAKTLMAECRAFVFPTLYEGFGIPPLEAIASGAGRIIVSDTPCMREIYADDAEYINPLDYDHADIPEEGRKVSSDILRKYSWKKSAKELENLLLQN